MANTYTWVVNNMISYPQAEGFTDVVVTVNWACNGTDGTYTGAMIGTTGEKQVIAIQNDVAAQIANNYYVPTILPNPWSA